MPKNSVKYKSAGEVHDVSIQLHDPFVEYSIGLVDLVAVLKLLSIVVREHLLAFAASDWTGYACPPHPANEESGAEKTKNNVNVRNDLFPKKIWCALVSSIDYSTN